MSCGKRRGFTLVEIMIVVLILTILAMMVAPRIMNATTEARRAAVQQDLQSIRQQIELYKNEHSGRGPHVNEASQLDTANFAARLTGRTDADGKLNASGACGPYLRSWPKNPFVEGAAATQIKFGKNTSSPLDGSTGWFFSTRTLVLYANAGVAE